MSKCCVSLMAMFAMTTVQAVVASNCGGIKRDLVILLDSSSSIQEGNFTKAKQFLVSVIRDLDVGAEGYQIGIIRFSDSMAPVAFLGQFQKEELINKILEIDYIGGGTQTGKAIGGALKLFGRYNRPSAPNQIITVTDGASDDPEVITRNLQLVTDKQIEMISIGVGPSINIRELRSLASREELTYIVESYDDIGTIREALVSSSCGVTTTTTTTPTTTTSTTTTTTTPSTSLTTTTTTTTVVPSTATFSTSLSSTTPLSSTTVTLKAKATTEILDPTDSSKNSFSTASHTFADQQDEMAADEPADDSRRGSLMSSAPSNWMKIAGIAVGAFALVALTTGIVLALIRRSKNKKKKRFVETL